MLLELEIEQGLNALVSDANHVAAPAAVAAIGPGVSVQKVLIKTLAALAAVPGLDIYFGLIDKDHDASLP
jgi:hypothetical protein